MSTIEPERMLPDGLLPDGLPVGTLSLTMSKDEAAARESTVSILLKTIVQEAENLLHSEGKHGDCVQIWTQAPQADLVRERPNSADSAATGKHHRV